MQEKNPLITSQASKMRKIVAKYWQRRPRTLLTLGALTYVAFLVIWALCVPTSNTPVIMKLQEFSTREQSKSATVQISRRRFRCVAWRATSSCRPNGPREPQNDKNCSESIEDNTSGYCEIEDIDSGERFYTMRRYCNGLKGNIRFSCTSAPDFANFHVEGQVAVEKALVPSFSLPNVEKNRHDKRNGIVMVVYPKLLASAYATIRVLRDVLKCSLSIEIWFHMDEIDDKLVLLAPLQQLSINLGGISFHPIYNPNAKGFLSKIFAIYNSHFDRVLFLDADNVPVRDPSFLFSSTEFTANGAVFWPDFWHPQRTLFNLHGRSMLWELLDMPFVNMFEQESGQLLIDRKRHVAPLELVHFYTFHQSNFLEKLELVYGDKDLFRLAWLKLNAAFHMIRAVPAMAGRFENGSFCGMTMVQHDAEGNVLFLHRNQHKLTGERQEEVGKDKESTAEPEAAIGAKQLDEYPDPVIWTHLLSFRKEVDVKFYLIDAYRAAPDFPQWQPCYGKRYVDKQNLFELQDVANTSFAGIEFDIRHFAFEAAMLRHSREIQWIGSHPVNTTENRSG
ncbi:hypothetical protein P3T76_005825 [Phytophthora citrophthora]|uniref:Uncharacterized protein n=1 Tax=Phytophthora citrophthora TaxID=4793 RepID=A0AAD9GS19_9STRA|nr:hypothetical protein P3T76_005825 [Phytophthora citrophthora]